MISGEYWLTGDGSSTFADGDVGDYNHAMYAFGSAVGMDEDALYRLDKKGVEANANGIDFRAAARAWIEENLDEQYHEMDWTDPALLQAIREADVDLKCVQEYVALWGPDVESRCTDDDVASALGMAYLIEAGADKDYLEWLLSDLQGDPRDYAIEHMGWIRVQGDNFQMWTFGDGELAEIRGFDGWPETDDDDADLQQSSQEIGIEEASTGKHFSVPLQMIFNERLDAAKIVGLMNNREEFEKYKRATKQYEGEEHEHLALNPGPQIETYSAVGDNMKGILTYDGSVVAWEVSSGGGPHHDDIADLMNIQYVAKMTFDMSRNEMYVDTMNPAFSSVTQSAVRSFTGHSKDTSLLIESGTGRLRTTVSGYFSLLRHAPDPDDYNEGESDAKYEKDTRDYVDRINTTKTYSELYGREKSPEHAEADDPHVHLALNPLMTRCRVCDGTGGDNFADDGRGWCSACDGSGEVIKVRPEGEYDPRELALGIEVEKEHSSNLQRRSIIARQHLEEDPHYYTKLKKAGLNPPFNTPKADIDRCLEIEASVTEEEMPLYLDCMNGVPLSVRVKTPRDCDGRDVYDGCLLTGVFMHCRGKNPKELALGIEVEKEHSNSLQRRSITARQHLEEDPHYYTKLKKAGLNPPPKGSPTDLNLWVLDKFFSGKDEVPNRIDPTDVPHLRRCMSAGLIEAVAGPYGKRGGALRLTEKGKQAIREWSLGKNPEDTRVTESNPTMFAYRVHFFDGWNGKNRSMDTTAPSPAKAISNVRYRIAAERGIPLATMPRDMYSFKRVEQLG